MGLGIFRRCNTNYSFDAPAPNPDPQRWVLLSHTQFKNAYVLKVKYLDCTNFEGVKVMVYRGKYPGGRNLQERGLDPHFSETADSPIARFKPTAEGMALALKLASDFDDQYITLKAKVDELEEKLRKIRALC